MAYQPSTSIRDRRTDKYVQVSPLGHLKSAETTRLVGPNFLGTTVDTNFWTVTPVGTGSVTQANGSQVLATGATANSSVSVQSVRNGRFMFAEPNIYRGAVQLTTAGTANNVRRWGTSVCGFQLSGSTFGIFTSKGGSDTVVASGSFNGDGTLSGGTYALDTNVHAYEIVYFVMGAWFYVDGALIHTVLPTTTSIFDVLSAPVLFSNTNSGGSTTDVSMTCLATSILRFGAVTPRPHYAHITSNTTTVCKRGGGTIHRITINAKGGNNNTATIYDNTAASGTVIGVLDTTTSLQAIEYDLDFQTGLTIVTATGSAPDITVVYD